MTLRILAGLLCAAVGSAIAHANIIWDNFPGDIYQPQRRFASEFIPSATLARDAWTIDDFQFNQPTQLESFEWVGMRDFAFEYPLAEYAIYQAQRDKGGQISGFLPLLGGSTGYIANSLAIVNDLDVYRARINLPQIQLAPGEYFLGLRLVGSSIFRGGRNFAVVSSSGSANVYGSTAFVRDPSLGGAFVNFTPSTLVPGSPDPVDVAFRINGIVIPEPATAMTSLVLLALLSRARRS